jgi:hypothetical protein
MKESLSEVATSLLRLVMAMCRVVGTGHEHHKVNLLDGTAFVYFEAFELMDQPKLPDLMHEEVHDL